MVDFFQLGQALTLILIVSSVFVTAVNTLTSDIIPGGIIGSESELSSLNEFVDVSESDLQALDQNNLSTVRSTAPNNPVSFLAQLVASVGLMGRMVVSLLVGWTVLIDVIFNPYGLEVLGNVIKTLFGVIEAFFIFRFLAIAVQVILGGST